MGEDILKQIQELVINLPLRDISLGKKFIKERNFELLKELVDSAIKIDRIREENDKKPLAKDFVGLIMLKTKVDKYCSLLGITKPENDNYDYFDECEGWNEDE